MAEEEETLVIEIVFTKSEFIEMFKNCTKNIEKEFYVAKEQYCAYDLVVQDLKSYVYCPWDDDEDYDNGD